MSACTGVVDLGTKADTLNRLYGLLSHAEVLSQFCFTVNEFRTNRNKIINDFRNLPWNKKVIVRSSAINEDTNEKSQAGRFKTVINVENDVMFESAVHAVIDSYEDENPCNQVLVQPMLENVKICGVAFTRDPNSLGNYYVINYDESGSTSAITSGSGSANRLLYVFKGNDEDQPEWIRRFCMVLRELEDLFGQDPLDVEFAVDNRGGVFILQVRMLCIHGQTVDYQSQYEALKRVEAKIRMEACPKPYLCGNRNIYGVMPDWNPAEMIGIRPKALALSLYREMITDSVWAYQRDNYGYRNLRSFPLMVDFCGLPYIDVRVSFNSFVPAELEEAISEKLVNYYLDRLAMEPAKHDKIEFDIVFSCYALDLPERIQVLEEYGFTQDEIQRILCALRNVTNKVINPQTGLWRKDYEKIGILEDRYHIITDSDMDELEKIYWLIEDCKRYGTLPFAGLARGAFIAVQFLESMVKKGILSEEDYQNFMNDVDTVGSNMNRDFNSMTRTEFLKKYGHLRPGTYDINSLRYDEAPDLYFNWKDKIHGMEDNAQKNRKKKFSLSMDQMHHLKDILEESGLHNDILGLMDFIKTVIEGREYGKFIFTRSLSKVIQMIGNLGGKYGLGREECAYLNIQAVKGLYSSAQDTGKVLRRSVAEGKENHKIAKALVLPPLLISPNDIWGFHYPDTEPNFITMKRAEGETVVLDGYMEPADIAGKIVLISCADPGYDWIFSHHVRGFVTMYGGANSHMAIRAGELGIPAVIGVGEKQYGKLQKARALEIDGMAKTVRAL